MILPPGRRRQAWLANIEGMLREASGDRVLPFHRGATREYADIAAAHRAAGSAVATVDCPIAAIARSRGMAVATRDVRGFGDIGIEVIDPWAIA